MLTSVAVAGTVVGFFPPKNGSFIAHLTVLESAPMMLLNPFLSFSENQFGERRDVN